MDSTSGGTTRRPRGRPRGSGSGREGSGTVQALDRGLSILKALGQNGPMILSDISMTLGMPPSTAHRLLDTLARHGFVALDAASQRWSVGVEAFRIGSAFLAHANLVETARGVLRQLMEETGETANLAIAENGHVVFVSQVETPQPIRAFFRAGTRTPMHASGIGKALMAEMDEDEIRRILQKTGLPAFTDNTITTPGRLFDDLARIRARGWSFDNEEHHLGMRCVAATIHNAHGEAVAGVSISGPRARLDDGRIDEVAPRVRAAARQITERIGGIPPAHSAKPPGGG